MRKLFVVSAGLVWLNLIVCFLSSADEIYLDNDDKISGVILSETDASILVQTESMGDIEINKKYVKKTISTQPKMAEEYEQEGIPWKREASVGYSISSGNTKKSQLETKLAVHRKTDHNEFHLEAGSLYAESNKKMDTQKWNGMSRYAFSFGNELKWYNFYKGEVGHDKFADIDYRVIPSTGIGYWFSDEAPTKAMTELAIGVEHTAYTSGTSDSTDPLIIPRFYFEQTLFGDTTFSEDFFIYSTIGEFDEYRVHSETALNNPITDILSLRISLVDDYDPTPSSNVEKNDILLMTSLVLKF